MLPLATLLGWLFFRSPIISCLYRGTIASRHKSWRYLFGHGAIAALFIARTARQFLALRPAPLLAGALLAAGTAVIGLLPTAALALTAASVALTLAVKRLPEDQIGHRVGYEGFYGQHCENTVEALKALALWDVANNGPAAPANQLDFPYIEFDVQETADGQLVLFHDLTLSRAFPRIGPNLEPITALETTSGPPFQLTTVQDLTLAQLQSLHLGGREGLRVPTLRRFLEACAEAGVRRPLAIEVKVLRTDAARRLLLEDVSWYLQSHGKALDADAAAAGRKHPHLGWAGIISFPHFFARCFGEYGNPQWRHWARDFQSHAIPARTCHFTYLTLIYGGS